MKKMTTNAISQEIEHTIASYITEALKSVGGDYCLTKCEDRIQVSHADYYNPNVPFEDVILSDKDCKDIFASFDKGIFEAYIKLYPNVKPVTANNTEIHRTNGAGDQDCVFDNIKMSMNYQKVVLCILKRRLDNYAQRA